MVFRWRVDGGPLLYAYWVGNGYGYCKFGNFRENFIFAKSVKRHICDVKISRTWHDLPISNEKVMSPIREGSIFTKLRIYLGGRLGALIRGPFRQVFFSEVTNLTMAHPRHCGDTSYVKYRNLSPAMSPGGGANISPNASADPEGGTGGPDIPWKITSYMGFYRE